jgi:hypothetical protein
MVMNLTDKRFVIVDLLETLAIANDDECKYYQNSNDDFKRLCELLSELYEENKSLKRRLMIAEDKVKGLME